MAPGARLMAASPTAPPTNTFPISSNSASLLCLALGHLSSLPWHSTPRGQAVGGEVEELL